MPKISKQLISKYIKTNCKKFLAVARPGANIFQIAGKNAEDLLYQLLEDEFIGYVINLKNRKINVKDVLKNNFKTELFIIEAEFVTDDLLEFFLNQFGSTLKEIKDPLDLSDIRPDIIMKIIPIEGETYYEVLSDGTLKKIMSNDDRIKLSILDVKNTEKSNTGYDAEIIFYAILLTIWLKKNNLSNKYVVTHKNGIFPAALKVNPFSKLYEPLKGENIKSKYDEFLKYVEYIEHDQVAITFRKILLDDIIPILKSPEDWDKLDWHISKKCGLCDWLGYDEWLSEENKQKLTQKHCFIQARSVDHISQIPFVSSAMRKVLEENKLSTISDIEQTRGTERPYQKHSKLKTDSFMIPKRARSILYNRDSSGNRLIYDVPKNYKTFTNIFVTLNFDPSTKIVSSISTKCHWREFSNFKERKLYQNNKNFPAQVFFTKNGDTDDEKEMLFLFLRQLDEYFSYANDPENNSYPEFQNSTYHIYFWDRTQYEEIRNLIGKHIGIIFEHELYKPLIWLFGSEKVLEDFSKVRVPNVSFVKDMLKANVALSLKFDYTLFEVAKNYTDFNKTISKAFYDPFSDYIPKERLYEVWLKHKNYQDIEDKYRFTAKAQVEALQFIAIQLHRDLHSLIKGEPSEINFDFFENFKSISRLPVDSKLWYLHQKLNEAYNERDKELDSFKHARELEVEYKAIILERLLFGEEKEEWLKQTGLPSSDKIFVYQVTEDSRDTKIKDSAENLSIGFYEDPLFLVQKFGRFIHDQNVDAEDYISLFKRKMSDVFQMHIVHFDRVSGIIAIAPNEYNKASWFLIEQKLINMDEKLYLVDLDSYKTSKYTLKYLKAIQTPLISHADRVTLNTLGLSKDMKGKKTHRETMAAKVLWAGDDLQSCSSQYTEEMIRIVYNKVVEDLKKQPNERQEEAILNSLSRQLSIIWGPPGTGKTQTASILLKLLLSMVIQSGAPKNILISALTYQACVELFDKFYSLLDNEFKAIDFIMLHSKKRTEFLDFQQKVPSWMNLIITNSFDKIRNSLDDEVTKVVIAPIATLNSFFNDGEYNSPKYEHIGEYFDFVLLDEASQCDIANSLSVLYGLKDDAQIVILGDHLQMPPIHKIKPPIGLEYIVGSLLNYLRERFNVKPTMLNINYRSVPDIVEYITTLGYDDLTWHRDASDLKIKNKSIVENPYKYKLRNEDLFKSMFLPEHNVLAVTYSDGISSQANLFEATMVAASIIEAYNNFYDDSEIARYNEWFWNNAVGIVTPHKAQKALIGRLLEKIFPDQSSYIHGAIDTVERFQGGQRKFIVVSFGVGDPDIIAQEEEFLLNLNRTNVAISRAEDRVIVFISEDLIHHLPDDKEIIKTSKAIKNYVHQYCFNSTKYIVNFEEKNREIHLKIH